MDFRTEHFMLGPTEIVICSDKCVSPEEAQEILKDLAKKIRPYVRTQSSSVNLYSRK